MLKEKPDDPAGYAVRTAFGRPITAKEQATLAAFLEAQTKRYQGTPDARAALADLCQMLLSRMSLRMWIDAALFRLAHAGGWLDLSASLASRG